MKDFLMLFRQPDTFIQNATEEEARADHEKWETWMAGIIAQGRMGDGGSRLAKEGRVMKAGEVITDGPFVEIREMLGGFIMVKANDLDEAIALAKGCPALANGGSVEVRSEFR